MTKTILAVAMGLFSSVTLQAAEMPRETRLNSDDPRDLMLIHALDAFLPHFLQTLGSPGMNIALGRGGEVVWEAAYGYADVAKKKKITPDTVFRSGSMGKVYTGVAIMQLVEQGVISLEDPINEHLPCKVENPLGGGEITVWNLMTHTPGLSADAAGGVLGKTRPLNVVVCDKFSQESFPMGGGMPLWHKPVGEERMYSNLGIATLGLIVERANPEGLSYSDYIEKNIMQPLGMTSSQYPPAQSAEYIKPEIFKRLSTGYATMGDVWLPTQAVYFEEFPAGGFVSVPRDHLKLYLALANGGEYKGARILKPDTVEQMLTVQADTPFFHGKLRLNERQGLIYWLKDWATPDRAFHHGGGHMYGWRTMAIAWPEHDTAIVYAFNEWSPTTNQAFYNIDHFMKAWLQAEPKRLPALPKGIDNLAWKASYLRGLLYAESYFVIGAGHLDLADAEAAATAAVDKQWGLSEPLWDRKGFMAGVKDSLSLEARPQAIRAFAESDAMQVPLDEARQLAPFVGAHPPAAMVSLGGLLLESRD